MTWTRASRLVPPLDPRTDPRMALRYLEPYGPDPIVFGPERTLTVPEIIGAQQEQDTASAS